MIPQNLMVRVVIITAILSASLTGFYEELLCRELLTLFGSIVQKGKFSAGIPILLRVLNRVLLPTFGRPTIPTCDGTVVTYEQKQKAA